MSEQTAISKERTPLSIIPNQLRTSDFRFIKLKRKGKEPTETGWTTDKNYDSGSTYLKRHVDVDGGNYGVVPVGDGMCILDVDNLDWFQKNGIVELFRETFAVVTGSGGIHIYFKCPGFPQKKVPLHSFEGNVHLGEIYSGGSAYVVAPGSTHPNGNTYEIATDAEIQEFDYDIIKSALLKKCKNRLTRKAKSEERGVRVHQSPLSEELGLQITDFINIPGDAERSGDEYKIAHPVHGSSTGTNLSVNPIKNLWSCHRCSVGGGVVEWIAVQEGYIDCCDLSSGGVRGEVFTKVRDYLRTHGYRDQIDGPKNLPNIPEEQLKYALPARRRSPRLHHLLDDDSIISEYIGTMSQLTDAYPEYHFTGAITALSTLIGKNAELELSTGVIWPNIWTVILGASSISKKSTATKRAFELVKNISPERVLPSDFSPEGLLESLHEQPVGMIGVDEAGNLMSGMATKQYMAGLREHFCKIYDNSPINRRIKGTGKKGECNHLIIADTCVSQIWATTPEMFQKYSKIEDAESGLFYRFLYMSPSYFKESRPITRLGVEMKRAISAVEDKYRNYGTYFAENKLTVDITDEALDLWNEWDSITDKVSQEEVWTDSRKATHQRLRAYAWKLAMVFSIGSPDFYDRMESQGFKMPKGENLVIGKDYVLEAIRIIEDYYLPNALELLSGVALDEMNNTQDKIISVMTREGGVMKKRDLMRKLHVTVKVLEESMDALKMGGEVHEFTVTGKTGKVMSMYRLGGAPDGEENT